MSLILVVISLIVEVVVVVVVVVGVIVTVIVVVVVAVLVAVVIVGEEGVVTECGHACGGSMTGWIFNSAGWRRKDVCVGREGGNR